MQGAISKLPDRPCAPGDRGIWVKSKCLNREEFVVVGWTDPEGSRSHIGALLLGYYTDDGQLHYAGREGTGMTDKELKRLASGTFATTSLCYWIAWRSSNSTPQNAGAQQCMQWSRWRSPA